MVRTKFGCGIMAGLALAGLLMACESTYETLPPATVGEPAHLPDYVIGPDDIVDIFVWQNEDLSVEVPVRPDGKISVPLIGDLPAVGFTPRKLALEIEKRLAAFIVNPKVTVSVELNQGLFSPRVRVVGAAVNPDAVPYKANMTVLDVIVETGGLTEFAAGNKARIVRVIDGEYQQYGVRLDDLLEDGDMTANVFVYPGDILIVPESFF